jgi:hypothetical protein
MGSWANPTGPTRVLAYILSHHCSQCSQTNSEPPPNRGVKAAVRGVLDGELKPLDFRFFIGSLPRMNQTVGIQFRGGLEFKAYRLLCHSALSPRVIKKKTI